MIIVDDFKFLSIDLNLKEISKENVLKDFIEKVILESLVINKVMVFFKIKLLCDKNIGSVIGGCVILKLYNFGFESGGNVSGIFCKFVLNL